MQAVIDGNRGIVRTAVVSRGARGGFADDLPPIVRDPGKFQQVIFNLIIAAVRPSGNAMPHREG